MNDQLNLKPIVRLLVFSVFFVFAAVPFVSGQQNPIQAENALQGTRGWQSIPNQTGFTDTN